MPNFKTILKRLYVYYGLAKPGIIYGNLISAIGGFMLASKGNYRLGIFVALVSGVGLVIASGCVFNNYVDRDIDLLMSRTKNRALVKKLISERNALIYGLTLGIGGFLILGIFANFLTVGVGLVGWIFYVVMYSIWKRRSAYGTLVGTVAGAMPIVAGYTAVTNRFDLEALLLFVVMAVWQMPHFFAIAIRRQTDYEAAGIPVWPIKKGLKSTKQQIIIYIFGFIIACLLLSGFGYTGFIYLLAMLTTGMIWLGIAIKGLTTDDDLGWARQVFLFSLISLVIFSLMIAIDIKLT